MSDPEAEQIVNNKYRYYAGLVWNDFYTLLSVLDESIDKTDLDRCWKDFYLSFWKGSAEGHSFIDQIITAYLEKMPIEDRDILEMADSAECVREIFKQSIVQVIREKAFLYMDRLVEEIKEQLMESRIPLLESLREGFTLFSSYELPAEFNPEERELQEIYDRDVRDLCRNSLQRLSPKDIWIFWLVTPQSDRWPSEGHLPSSSGMFDDLAYLLFTRVDTLSDHHS
jgi:hypothetical protein